MGVVDSLVNLLRPKNGTGLQDWLDAAADMGEKRVTNYKLFRDYYNGDMGALLRDRARRYLQRHGVQFCENFTDVVVDTLAERLEVVGFKTSLAEDAETDLLADTVWEWWQAERLDQQQNTIHTETLMLGDAAVMVVWDEDLARPCVERQKAEQVKFVYSPDTPDMVEYACKVWATRKIGPSNPNGLPVQRLNIYWPDRLEKWYRLEGDKTVWEAWQDEDDTTWPVWLTDTGTADGEALGIPLVHFRHKPLGDSYGRSRVKGAIPFQEQLNKYAADLNDLVDNHALPQDWVTGVTGSSDYKRVPGEIWEATSETVEFGRLDATPTSNLLDAIEGLLSRLARKQRIPMHLLTGGTPPSGESLKTSESGLVSTAKLCQVEFGNAWEDVMMLALKLASVYGDQAPLQQDSRIEALWENPQTRSDKDDLEVASLKQNIGVSNRTLLRELGYDPDFEMNQSNAEKTEAAEIEAKAFDAGSPLR